MFVLSKAVEDCGSMYPYHSTEFSSVIGASLFWPCAILSYYLQSLVDDHIVGAGRILNYYFNSGIIARVR
jgi:hypothetical protein